MVFYFSSSNEIKLRYLISVWDSDISDLRNTTIKSVKSLLTKSSEKEAEFVVTKEIVEKAVDCHLRPQKKNKNKKKCPVCIANEILKQYEYKLFSMVKRDNDDMSNLGAWKPSREEIALKGICKLY